MPIDERITLGNHIHCLWHLGGHRSEDATLDQKTIPVWMLDHYLVKHSRVICDRRIRGGLVHLLIPTVVDVATSEHVSGSRVSTAAAGGSADDGFSG